MSNPFLKTASWRFLIDFIKTYIIKSFKVIFHIYLVELLVIIITRFYLLKLVYAIPIEGHLYLHQSVMNNLDMQVVRSPADKLFFFPIQYFFIISAWCFLHSSDHFMFSFLSWGPSGISLFYELSA